MSDAQQVCLYHTTDGVADGFPSTVAGTAPPLAAAATLTTSWFRTRRDPLNANATTLPIYHQGLRLLGSVTADQVSAAAPAGLILDQSNSFAATKTGVRSRNLGAVAVAGAVLEFDEQITAAFIRLRYVNGATAQGSMELAAWVEGENA